MNFAIYNIAIVIPIFISIYLTFKYCKEKNLLKKLLDNIEARSEKRKFEDKRIKSIDGNTERIKFLSHIDLMLQRSNLKISSEIYLGITLFIAIAGYFISRCILKNYIFNTSIFFITIFISYETIYIISKIMFEKIDNNILLFINVLDNFAATNDDIVDIFEKSIPYLSNPLKKDIEIFVSQCKINGNIKNAFERLEDKIENDRLKNILKNLEIASRHEANYSDILREARDILKGYFKNKATRKSLNTNGKVEIGMCLIMSIAMISMMKGMMPNLIQDLTQTPNGNCILIYCLIVLLICVKQFISFE